MAMSLYGVWRAVLAALVLAPTVGFTQSLVNYNPGLGAVTVKGLGDGLVESLVEGRAHVRLQLASKPNARSMLVSLVPGDQGVEITPRFKLKAGKAYRLSIGPARADGVEHVFRVPGSEAVVPRLTGVAPSVAEWPANILRIHLQFSQPMARGQVRDAVWLESAGGTRVDAAFLSMAAELWDRHQRQLTLLLDPGRIKQGVGPNQQVGPPLQKGKRYRLVVAGTFRSAEGVAIGRDIQHAFAVGEAERRVISPAGWRVDTPAVSTRETLTVHFDRVLDELALQRLVAIRDAAGQPIAGAVSTDGLSWRFTPSQAWRQHPTLVVQAALEDIAGNRMRAAFDASLGTRRTTRAEAVRLPLLLR